MRRCCPRCLRELTMWEPLDGSQYPTCRRCGPVDVWLVVSAAGRVVAPADPEGVALGSTLLSNLDDLQIAVATALSRRSARSPWLP